MVYLSTGLSLNSSGACAAVGVDDDGIDDDGEDSGDSGVDGDGGARGTVRRSCGDGVWGGGRGEAVVAILWGAVRSVAAVGSMF